MARKFWKRNDEGKLVEFNPYKIKTGKGSHLFNMRKTLSGTTKMEFNSTTVQESIDRMNK